MKVLVIGAAGMIGRKLCDRLAKDGRLAGQPIEEALFVDIVSPAPPAAPFPVKVDVGRYCRPLRSAKVHRRVVPT